jgi:beta-glucosidase
LDDVEARVEELLGRLDLEAKVRLCTGASSWTTWDEPAAGLRPIVVSDGPAGVRGQAWDERQTSTNLPSPTCMAASWDEDLAERLGRFLATEARAKGVDVLLGPTINLHRSPLGGRHFECFSEDPLLTARIGAAYVRGVQDEASPPPPSTTWPTTPRPSGSPSTPGWGSGPCASSTWPRSSTWSARPAPGW